MKKKEYERPTMQVVHLKGQQQLLAGSVAGVRQEDYGVAFEDIWE